MPFLTTAALVGGSLAAGLGGAAISSSAAGHAADTQAQAAEYAAGLQKQAADASLATQQQQYQNSNTLEAPLYMNGVAANANLANLMGVLSPTAGAQPLVNPATLPATTSQGAAANLKPGTKPANIDQTTWNSLGKWQQIALTHPGVDTSAGVKQSGATPDDFSKGAWSKLTPDQQKALMQVGNPYTPPAATSTGGIPAGTQNIASLVDPSLGATGSLLQPFGETWSAPTGVTEQNDPGYQFRLQQAQLADDRSAAAKGNLLTGGTLAAENAHAQGIASNEYGNVYARAKDTFDTHYNQFEQHNNDIYNRLAALSGTGQTTANQLSSNGLNFANQQTTTNLDAAAQQAQQLNNAAAATASGYVASGNAYGNAFGGLSKNLMDLILKQQNPYGGSVPFVPADDGGH